MLFFEKKVEKVLVVKKKAIPLHTSNDKNIKQRSRSSTE